MIIFEAREVETMAIHPKQYKELSCKDFRSDCSFMVRAETSEELMRYGLEHSCNHHGKCDSSPESIKKTKSHIKDVWI